jgi:hypothetical protein
MYNYQTERPKLFTENSVEMILKIKKNIQNMVEVSGAVDFCHATKGVTGDSWTQLAALDYLVEKGEIREDIDVKFLGFIMTQMSIATFEYWRGQEENEGYNLKEYTQNVLNTVDIYLDLIKNGIRK